MIVYRISFNGTVSYVSVNGTTRDKSKAVIFPSRADAETAVSAMDNEPRQFLEV